MHVVITDKGVSVELSCGDAVALLEQLGDVSAKGRPKVRQLHQQIENALTWRGQVARELAPPLFSHALDTDLTVPPWRKCDLVFTAERLCRVDAVAPWQGFRLEPLTLPVLLRAGESIRLRLANETGIDHMAGVVVSGVHLP